MLVRQININKAKAGSDNLCLMISKGEISNIYLVQEPYRLKNGNIPGLPKDFRIFGLGSSRAIIIAHSNWITISKIQGGIPKCSENQWEDFFGGGRTWFS